MFRIDVKGMGAWREGVMLVIGIILHFFCRQPIYSIYLEDAGALVFITTWRKKLKIGERYLQAKYKDWIWTNCHSKCKNSDSQTF